MSESLYSILLLGIKTLPSHQIIVVITFFGNSYAVLARKIRPMAVVFTGQRIGKNRYWYAPCR